LGDPTSQRQVSLRCCRSPNGAWLAGELTLTTHSGPTAAADKLIVADGFSCREQIEQGTGRGTLHLAEALARMVRN
jgi:hypothetical protein